MSDQHERVESAPESATAEEAVEEMATAEGVREDEGQPEDEGEAERDENDESDESDDVGFPRSHLKGLLEALVFVADRPVSLNDLVKSTGADRSLLRSLLAELINEYKGRGIHLQEVANGFTFRTSAAFAPFLRDQAARKPVRMTRAQLETLAIIAYRQPLTRPDIDEIRGVDSGAVLKMLLERDFVRILGKKDEPGRPLLYGTTNQFLEFFGLKALRDLPTLRELTELTEESRRILERELGEEEAREVMGEGVREGEREGAGGHPSERGSEDEGVREREGESAGGDSSESGGED